MTDRGTLRGRWVEEICRTPHISAEVKVLLLSLAYYDMDEGGRVSVPRDVIAERLACHPRKVTEKLKAAIGEGLLRQTARGQKHRTAIYAAIVPGVTQSDGNGLSEPDSQGADSRPPEASQGADSRPPEQNSQGASRRHPENSQGADSRPPEASQGADSRPPNMYGGFDAGDHLEDVDAHSLSIKGSAATRRDPHTPKPGSKPKKPRRKPERPIPDIFPITAEMRAWATGHSRKITVSLEDQTERFINHARQNDRHCRDWVAAWRNWILKAQDFADVDRRASATGTDGRPEHGPLANVNAKWGNGQEITL